MLAAAELNGSAAYAGTVALAFTAAAMQATAAALISSFLNIVTDSSRTDVVAGEI